MTGNKTTDTIILAFSTLVASGLLGVFIYTEVVYQKPAIDAKSELEQMKQTIAQRTLPTTYKLDPIIVNLPSQSTRLRFLDVEIHIVPFDNKFAQQFETFKPQINDIVIDISTKMKPDELNSVAGKILLENRIKRAINQLLNANAVKEILFARFVIQ